MTEIEQLIKEAREAQKRWRLPKHEPKPSVKPWQLMLDRPYGRMEIKY